MELLSSLQKIKKLQISNKLFCIYFFQNIHRLKMHNNNFFLTIKNKKSHQIFLSDNYWVGIFFVLTGDVVNMQFTRRLVSSYLLNWFRGKQSSIFMVISLDSRFDKRFVQHKWFPKGFYQCNLSASK